MANQQSNWSEPGIFEVCLSRIFERGNTAAGNMNETELLKIRHGRPSISCAVAAVAVPIRRANDVGASDFEGESVRLAAQRPASGYRVCSFLFLDFFHAIVVAQQNG